MTFLVCLIQFHRIGCFVHLDSGHFISKEIPLDQRVLSPLVT